jgi:hypothetical protein
MRTFFRSFLFTAWLLMLFVVSSKGQTTVTIGTGTSSSNYPFTTFWMDGRTEILFTSTELLAGGAVAGNITDIGFNVIAASTQAMNGFTIKMQNTAQTSITGFVNTGWTTVYSTSYTVPGTGWQMITLTTPFVWDGASNLFIEICYHNTSYTSYSTVNATAAAGMTWGYYTDGASGCTLTGGAAQTIRPNTRLVFCATPAQPSAITGEVNPPENSSQVYSVTNVPGVTYNWTFPTGWVQTGGGTTNSVTVTVAIASGDITCTPSNTCGSGTPRTLAVTPSGVGVIELVDNSNISVTPNPTKGIVLIDFKGYTGNIIMNISNSQGVVVSSEVISAKTVNFAKTLDISKFPNGLYFLKFVNNGKTFVKKIVKQ